MNTVGLAAAAAALSLACGPSLAQVAAPRLPVLPLAFAEAAARAAIEACAKMNFHVSAAVVDVDGVSRVALRGDGAGAHTGQSAYRKAFTAASFGQPTSQIGALAEKSVDLSWMQHLDNVLFVGGGLPITIGDSVVGAIGVAGAVGRDGDEACAKAGLERAMSGQN